MTKVSLDGAIIWQVDGADIFVQPTSAPAQPFTVGPGVVTVTDWNGWIYTINTATGHTTVEKPDADAATSES